MKPRKARSPRALSPWPSIRAALRKRIDAALRDLSFAIGRRPTVKELAAFLGASNTTTRRSLQGPVHRGIVARDPLGRGRSAPHTPHQQPSPQPDGSDRPDAAPSQATRQVAGRPSRAAPRSGGRQRPGEHTSSPGE